MQCMTCNANIPPEWVAAIQANACPGCGGTIMDASAKELLDELREAIKRMPNDAEGLAGWILSNYQLQKVGTAEPTQFHRKPVENLQSPHPAEGNLKIANNPVQAMLKRTGMSKEIEASRHNALAALAKKIKSGSNKIEDGDFEPLEEESETEEETDLSDVPLPFKISSALATSEEEADPMDVEEMESIMNASQETGNAQRILDMQRRDRLRRQEIVSSGGGSFKRS